MDDAQINPFDAQAERTPDAPALMDRRHLLAYCDMRRHVVRLARERRSGSNAPSRTA